MAVPGRVPCEICHAMADIMQNEQMDESGKVITWPKAANKADGIYFTINCPTCGEREQRLLRYEDTD